MAEKNWKDTFARVLTISLVLLIAVGGMLFAWPTFLRTRELKRQNAELDETIDARRAEIARLKEYQSRFRADPDFVERIARQNHRVFPGELVFVYEKDAR